MAIRSKQIWCLIIFFSMALSIGSPKGHTKEWLKYETDLVTLTGKVVEVTKYGPPNYGENPKTDEKIKVLILQLKKPINVEKDNTSAVNATSYEGIKEVQLVFDHAPKNKPHFLNEKVVVKGTLFQAHTGHHFTDVLADVMNIRIMREKL